MFEVLDLYNYYDQLYFLYPNSFLYGLRQICRQTREYCIRVRSQHRVVAVDFMGVWIMKVEYMSRKTQECHACPKCHCSMRTMRPSAPTCSPKRSRRKVAACGEGA